MLCLIFRTFQDFKFLVKKKNNAKKIFRILLKEYCKLLVFIMVIKFLVSVAVKR